MWYIMRVEVAGRTDVRGVRVKSINITIDLSTKTGSELRCEEACPWCIYQSTEMETAKFFVLSIHHQHQEMPSSLHFKPTCEAFSDLSLLTSLLV